MSQPKILLIEDNPKIREKLQSLLSPYASQVITASDGIEGLLLYNQYQPHFVVLEQFLPLLSGEELILRFRQSLAPAQLPLFMMTSSRFGVIPSNIRTKINYLFIKPLRTQQIQEVFAAVSAQYQPDWYPPQIRMPGRKEDFFHLQGDLAQHSVFQLFLTLEQQQATGLLSLMLPQGMRRIAFIQGRPVYSESFIPEEQFTALVYKRFHEQLAQKTLEKLTAGSGGRAILQKEALERSDLLPQTTLQSIYNYYIEELIIRSLHQRTGHFRFIDDVAYAHRSSNREPLGLFPLLLESTFRYQGLQEIHAELAPYEQQFCMLKQNYQHYIPMLSSRFPEFSVAPERIHNQPLWQLLQHFTNNPECNAKFLKALLDARLVTLQASPSATSSGVPRIPHHMGRPNHPMHAGGPPQQAPYYNPKTTNNFNLVQAANPQAFTGIPQHGFLPQGGPGQFPSGGHNPNIPQGYGKIPTGSFPQMPHGKIPTGSYPQTQRGKIPTGSYPQTAQGKMPTGAFPQMTRGMGTGNHPRIPGRGGPPTGNYPNIQSHPHNGGMPPGAQKTGSFVGIPPGTQKTGSFVGIPPGRMHHPQSGAALPHEQRGGYHPQQGHSTGSFRTTGTHAGPRPAPQPHSQGMPIQDNAPPTSPGFTPPQEFNQPNISRDFLRVQSENYFMVLGLSDEASKEELIDRYKELREFYSPENQAGFSPAEQSKAQVIVQKITQANRILQNTQAHLQHQQYIQKRYHKQDQQQYAQQQYEQGTVLFRAKSYQRATEHFRRALDADPNQALYHFDLGCSLYHSANADPAQLLLARSYMERALELDPNMEEAHLYLGIITNNQ
mgnify:CR=1 FL=1